MGDGGGGGVDTTQAEDGGGGVKNTPFRPLARTFLAGEGREKVPPTQSRPF